jgi:hypothetical protein
MIAPYSRFERDIFATWSWPSSVGCNLEFDEIETLTKALKSPVGGSSFGISDWAAGCGGNLVTQPLSIGGFGDETTSIA